MALPSALAPLCAVPHWVLWRRVLRDDPRHDEDWTKPPFQVRAPKRKASTADPSDWAPYELAAAVAQREGLCGIRGGCGFVLEHSGFGGVDLDRCMDWETGSFFSWAQNIIDQARSVGCYVETSPSGCGVHILGRSSGRAVHTKWGVGGGVVEVFRDTRRFLTVTGKQIFNCADIGSIDELIDELIAGRPEGKAARNGANGHGRAAAAGADSSPSGLFHKAVSKLAEQGLDVREIVAQLRKYAKRYDETSIKKYEAQGRLAEEVGRVLEKWERKHGAQLKVEWSTGRLPKACCADARVAVMAMGVECSYDEFHLRYLVRGEVLKPKWVGELDDNKAAHIRHLIWEHFHFDPGKNHLDDALTQLCLANSFHPILEQWEKLQWDGKRRVDSLLPYYWGAVDTPLNRAIGRKVMIAHVRRVKQPGVKFDQIIVQEGVTNAGKSSSIKLLVGAENFSDQSILDQSDQKQQEMLQGHMAHEIADLKGMKHADVEAVKAFASRSVDRARPAYGRRRVDQPRTVVMWATTEEVGGNYLKADTNRRWWPFLVGAIKLHSLRRDRDQLWAEAIELEATGESLELPPELWEAMIAEQEKRREFDPWFDTLEQVHGERWPRRDGLEGWEERIANDTVMYGVLGLKKTDAGPGVWRRLTLLMKQLGWTRPEFKLRMKGRGPQRGWFRCHD